MVCCALLEFPFASKYDSVAITDRKFKKEIVLQEIEPLSNRAVLPCVKKPIRFNAKDTWSCQVTCFNGYQPVRIDPSLKTQKCFQTDLFHQGFLPDNLILIEISNLNHLAFYQPFCLQTKWEEAGAVDPLPFSAALTSSFTRFVW